MSDSKNSNFFLGFILGAVMGGAIALLLAPSSGEENIKKIKDCFNENRDKLDDLKDNIESYMTKGKDYIDTKAETLRSTIEKLKENTQEDF